MNVLAYVVAVVAPFADPRNARQASSKMRSRLIEVVRPSFSHTKFAMPQGMKAIGWLMVKSIALVAIAGAALASACGFDAGVVGRQRAEPRAGPAGRAIDDVRVAAG